ncbi:long-chain fatty acid--CoA ligase [Streptomyces sp. AD16]|nr:long-chain fatty acid--CoA ligase [Streptomyces sp. AD16]
MDALTRGLQESGVGSGDVVALHLANSWEYLTLHLAAASAGAVTMPVHQGNAPRTSGPCWSGSSPQPSSCRRGPRRARARSAARRCARPCPTCAPCSSRATRRARAPRR